MKYKKVAGMGSVKSPRFSVEEGIHSLMALLPLLCLLGRKERFRNMFSCTGDMQPVDGR